MLVLLLCCTLNACTKSLSTDNPNATSKSEYLANDSSFENIIDLEIEMQALLQKIMVKKGISSSTLNALVNQLKAESKTEIDFKEKMNRSISPNLYEKLIDFEKRYNKNWKALTDKYFELSSNDIQLACTKYYEQLELKKINVASKKASSFEKDPIAGRCGWRYSLCLAGATAAAMICHTGCVGATAGLGTPVCVFLCGTIQVSVGVECMNNYCEL